MSATATMPAVPNVAERDVVVICAWCPQLHIMRLERGAGDLILVLQQGQDVRIHRNGKALSISHGICEACELRERNG